MKISGFSKISIATGLIMCAYFSLSLWKIMPLYPDEVAFRIASTRYIQDHGLNHGLYALCLSNLKQTPLLFTSSAWLLSWVDLNFSPTQVRWVPFLTIFTAIIIVIIHSVIKTRFIAASSVLTALVGVSGSGLVLARPEFIQELNLVFCLIAYLLIESGTKNYSIRILITILLIFSNLTSMYSHPQGVLFLPLTIYTTYLLLSDQTDNQFLFLSLLMLFVLFVYVDVEYNRFNCDGFPAITHFTQQATSNLIDIRSTKLINWFGLKVERYLSSFEYRNQYAINYLPGLTAEVSWFAKLISAMNVGIRLTLIINIIIPTMFLFATLIKAASFLHTYFKSPIYSVSRTEFLLNHNRLMPIILSVLPVLFLFIYDNAQNFYRNFFINFILVIITALLLTSTYFNKLTILLKMYLVLCVFMILASYFINFLWFLPALDNGYEGPSVSFRQNFASIHNDVHDLEKSCSINIQKGKVIVDDLTYDSLKQTSEVYPITYLFLMAEQNKMSISQVLAIVQPNSAIARCSYLNSTTNGQPIGFDHKENQLCCVNFKNKNWTR